MRINELLKIQYHDTLNPAIWDGASLHVEVAQKLKEIASAFIDYIDVPELSIVDIVITGSNANYNWTAESDIDLHIIVDIDEYKQRCPEFAEDFFRDKKTLWNEHHDIQVYDHDVEVYVQDVREYHNATGLYSLSKETWIVEPEYKIPEYNDSAVEAKAKQLKYEIDHIIEINANATEVQQFKDKLRKMRQSGLASGGEFSTENLAFKELRYSGYLSKLSEYSKHIVNTKLSLDKDLLDKPVSNLL